MDLELLRTFLEVYRTRHFGRAANNLFVTQSAISARIRLLEETLGVQVLTRTRNDIRLTAAGQRLLPHAEALLNAWHRARQDTQLDQKTSLTIGGEFGLWDILIQDWVNMLFRSLPDVVLNCVGHESDTLIRRLLDGMVDIGFLYEPPPLPELIVKKVTSIKLILVSSEPNQTADAAMEDSYIMVDWGTSFTAAHARHFPERQTPAIRVGYSSMALSLLKICGGCAYLAERNIIDHLRDGTLHRVEDAPEIERQAYGVYRAKSERLDLVEEVLAYI